MQLTTNQFVTFFSKSEPRVKQIQHSPPPQRAFTTKWFQTAIGFQLTCFRRDEQINVKNKSI